MEDIESSLIELIGLRSHEDTMIALGMDPMFMYEDLMDDLRLLPEDRLELFEEELEEMAEIEADRGPQGAIDPPPAAGEKGDIPK